MEFDFKKWFPVYLICNAIFIGIFLWGCHLVREDSLSIRNWEQGDYSTTEAVCIDLILHDGKHDHRWEFVFSDGTSADLDYDARFGFDEAYYRTIMHRPLKYIYAEPSHALMDIKDGGESLLDTDYGINHLYSVRTSSIFFALMMSPLPLVYIVLTTVEAVKYFKKRKMDN